MADLKELVKRQGEYLSTIRRELHKIPEPAYTEEKTSAFVAERLREAGLLQKLGLAKYGVVGLLETGRPGPTVMYRADMDALPMAEATGLPFASTHEGRMHACGHDCHMAMALGLARVLQELGERLRGRALFVFQPAEEGPGGAKPMIEEGVLDDPPVDYAFGCHVWPDLPAGTVGVKAGALMAAMDRFDLKIIGKQGHGAMPHLCVDALEIATQVVGGLQRLVSRQIHPLEPAVVTVGTFQAGTAFNVIAGTAELSGTTRTFDLNLWNQWPRLMETMVAGICQANRAGYDFKYAQGYPPTINHAGMAAVVERAARATVGPERVVEPRPTMGGEDMSFFLQKVPGCYYFLGVGGEGVTGVHNPGFSPDEGVLLTGTEVAARVMLELMGQ